MSDRPDRPDPPDRPLGGGFDVAGTQLTREARQQLGHQAAMALGSIVRNARNYSEDNKVFAPALAQLQESMLELLSADGTFELLLAEGGIFVNRQSLRFDAMTSPVMESIKVELQQRGVSGMTASLAPPRDELRTLVQLFTPRGPQHPTERGDARRPLQIIKLLVRAADEQPAVPIDVDAQLLEAYAHAVFFVDRTIDQLRSSGEQIPIWAASRVMQDLVDLQRRVPRRFLRLAAVKPPGEAYWGHHAANVAVLAVSFGDRLGCGRRRCHDLGMAALLHDVGVAALPPSLLQKTEALSEREKGAMRASPLFAARAVLRDREVHAAALERAQAAYECHLDLVPPPGEPLAEIGFLGRVLALCEAFDALTTERPFRPARTPQDALRVMNTELVFRFDPLLLDLFPQVVEPLLS